MTPRLASLYDKDSVEAKQRPVSSEVETCDAKSRLGIPGRLLIGDLIRARACPSIQGVVLGKTKGREAVRVLLAPYASGSIPVASVIIDIPAAIIPVQDCPVSFSFWNPVAVQNYVHYLAKRGQIKREQENQLLTWVNSKQYPEESVFSAASELSIPPVASPGLVKSRVREHEQAAHPQATSVAVAAQTAIVVIGEEANNEAAEQLGQHCDMPETRARSSDAKERRDTPISLPPSESSTSRVNLGTSVTMAPTQIDSSLQSQFQQLSLEVKQQFEELTKLVTGIARRQKVVEDKLSESASSNAAQWEELDVRLNAVTQRPQDTTERSRPKERQGGPPSEDGEPDWIPKNNRRDEADWQVQSKQLGRAAAIENVEEFIECPFSLQSRRNDGFRVPRAHRRAHRRLLEEVYGANDSAVAAAHQLLGQLEKDTHTPAWETAMLLQVAKGLDILLLEHEDGMWAQWNQPIIDFLARFYFEMVARVRPDEDVVQLMQPELQKRLREFNFGKQRTYGPVTQLGRQNRNWKSQYDKPFAKESGYQRKNQWGNNEKPTDATSSSSDTAAGQGAWMWHPGVATQKATQPFRPDPPPYPPAPPAPRPPQ